ncbi:NAD-dependent epimerase/dehydratase family protein [Lederbergia wuyishanensis]|uniref:Nucleoside-diphosphate-sugar epimerase n=1 Tax=Lederbergia wuyishanensis TaxID=1347903 RepID=A0ABU0DA39_9BACI|nr:NAD-dependent epimerase/dehydratase family protein [Lederbergia wuyishanensis]MCJ8008448.1 NAD-dependent epimerase/dehydratase family protein [Lederbergia wuyishanensis]MDQ0345191.1 nucleoside-diphosphate-sugar epimerase [Lederbergia wuyishanensis]
MKTALVLGGTRFFGKELVRSLLSRGVDVTVATRGKSGNPFGEEVKQLIADRYDIDSLKTACGGFHFDVVYDQIGYSSEDINIAYEALKDQVGKYVFTSTMSVYEYGNLLNEEEFNPFTYPLQIVKSQEVSYGEGKKLAETALFSKTGLPAVSVRIPIVLGEEDYTERLLFHVKKIKNGEDIGMPNPEARLNFISASEAGEFLAWIGTQDFTGPVNACANGDIQLSELINLIESKLEKSAILTTDITDENRSPYGIKETWTMDNSKAKNLGYEFSNLKDWLPGLIDYYNEII